MDQMKRPYEKCDKRKTTFGNNQRLGNFNKQKTGKTPLRFTATFIRFMPVLHTILRLESDYEKLELQEDETTNRTK